MMLKASIRRETRRTSAEQILQAVEALAGDPGESI